MPGRTSVSRLTFRRSVRLVPRLGPPGVPSSPDSGLVAAARDVAAAAETGWHAPTRQSAAAKGTRRRRNHRLRIVLGCSLRRFSPISSTHCRGVTANHDEPADFP